MGSLRLDKYLCDMGKGSRSQIKEAARKGRISVNGIPEKKADRRIDPDQDKVSLDGRIVGYAEYEYYMLNKPQGVVSATEDSRHDTVVDLILERKRGDLFPVGRLDIDTEGLLLITNDGALAHDLLSPKKHVDKVYYAEIKGMITEETIRRFAGGIQLSEGVTARPALLEIISREENFAKVLITLREGRFHQVKRMAEAVGSRVTYLKRLSMGPLKLDASLAPGEYRALTEAELRALKAKSGSKGDAECTEEDNG